MTGALECLAPRSLEFERVAPVAAIIPESPPAVVVNNALTLLIRNVLTLRPEHRAALRARGLGDAKITRLRYVSVPVTAAERQRAADALAPNLDASGGGVPGFYRDCGRWRMVYRPPGFLIPVRDECGHIQALSQRVERPTGPDKYIWLSSNPDAVDDNGRQKYPLGASSGTPPHFAGRHLLYSAPEVIVTEGSLKADVAAYLSGAPVIGVAGTHAFGGLAARLRAGFPLLRDVVVAYDMDVVVKPQVRAALEDLTARLEATDFRVRIRTWPDKWKGYDDYLLAQLREGRAAAQ
jgi:DNA primase